MRKNPLTGKGLLCILWLLTAPVLIACSGDEERGRPADSARQPISFDLTIDERGDYTDNTRGYLQNSLKGDVIVGMMASQYSESAGWGDGRPLSFMYNERVEYTGAGWSTESAFIIAPENGKLMRFFGYAPYSRDITSATQPLIMSGEDYQGQPYFSYTVPENAADQVDLMVGWSKEINTDTLANSPLKMDFKHLLTAIRFTLDESVPVGKVTKIRLLNVKYKGNYTFGNDTWDDINNELTNLQLDTTMVAFNYMGSATPVEIADDQVFLVMPQRLGEDAKVEITFNNGIDYIIETDISGRKWPQGKVVNYNIKLKSLTQLTLVATIEDWKTGKTLNKEASYN